MTFFLETLWTGTLLIALVLILRALLGTRIPAWLRYSLWLLPMLRLCFPVSLQHAMHLMPQSNLSMMELPKISAAPAAAQPLLTNITTGQVVTTSNPDLIQRAASIDWQPILLAIWLIGMAAVILWCILVNRRFAGTLGQEFYAESPCGLPAYVADGLKSPCLYFRRGKAGIYIPREIAGDPVRLRHVFAHEEAHYRHYDHIWSIIRVILLAIYWFHPLVWVMAFFSKRDCEQACDEAAIRSLGETERLAYGHTLVGLMATGCPSDMICGVTTMTDSKKGIRQRVRRIANKPQTRVAAVLLLVIGMLLSMAFAFTDTHPHHKVCNYLQSGERFNTLALYYNEDGKAGSQMLLTDEQKKQVWDIFLDIKDTSMTSGVIRRDIAEWEIIFEPLGAADRVSLIFEGDQYLYVQRITGGENPVVRESYFVEDAKAIAALRQAVGLPPLYMFYENAAYYIINLDETHSYRHLNANYQLANLTTGDVKAVNASYASEADLPQLTPRESLAWEPPYGEKSTLADGQYQFTAFFTRDDGEQVKVSTYFAVGDAVPLTLTDVIGGTEWLTTEKLLAIARERGKDFCMADLEGYAYTAEDENGSRIYPVGNASLTMPDAENELDFLPTLSTQASHKVWHEIAPGSGEWDFLTLMQQSDVLNLGYFYRSDNLHTPAFALDHFLWEPPDNPFIDVMQYPVYGDAGDLDIHITAAFGDSDTPSSVILYSDTDAFTPVDVLTIAPEELESILGQLEQEPEMKRVSNPESLLFSFVGWGELSSAYPTFVRATGEGLGNGYLTKSMMFLNQYENTITFREDITNIPSLTPCLTLTYSGSGDHTMTLYKEDPSICTVMNGRNWACYTVPEGFRDFIVSYLKANGEPLVHYKNAEIQAAKQVVTEYFGTVATSRTLTRLYYNDDWCQWMRNSYLSNGHGATNGVKPENVIVLSCDFAVDGDEHTNWSMILIRDSKDGAWRIDDQGY